MPYTETLTKVLYPRFQIESPADGPLRKRTLAWRAEQKHWLLDVEVAGLKQPIEVVDEERSRIRGRWWGVHHYATRQQTLGRLFDVPLDTEDEPHLYRSQHILHESLWDHQATTAYGHEIVLERLRRDEPRFEPVAALLITQPGWNQPDEGQRLLIADEAGAWDAPEFGEINNQVDCCLLILGELATREGTDRFNGSY